MAIYERDAQLHWLGMQEFELIPIEALPKMTVGNHFLKWAWEL